MKLKEILAQKPNAIISFEASKNVQDATNEMYEKRIGALLLKSETGKFVGILTDRDILRFYAEQLGEADKVKVSDIMTEDFFVETLESTSDRAESVMTEKRVRHLPIVDGDQVVGMISIGDLVKAKLQETAVEAKSLRDYISS